MATQGPWTFIDRSLLKCWDGTIKLYSDTFHLVLLTSSQSISRSFLGSSGDARYADLTGELTTTNGYTVGGVAMTGTTLTRAAAAEVAWSTSVVSWTFTGGSVTYKYAAIVDWTTTNKDILAFMDVDTGGGSITPAATLYALNPDPSNGWINSVQL